MRLLGRRIRHTRNMPLLTGLLAGLALLGPAAMAQLTVQSSPVFSTQTPPEQTIGPAPAKPFPGEVVELETTGTKASQPVADDLKIPLNRIRLEGNRYYQAWVIRRYLKPLLDDPEHPMTAGRLKQELNRINRFNGFKLKATVESATGSEPSALRVDVYEPQPWQLVVTGDNQGRPGTGFYRGGVQLINKSLLGFGDEMSVQYVGSSRSHRLAAEYHIPLNTRGGEINFQYARQTVDYDPELTPPSVRDLTGRDQVWTVTLSQPIDKNRVWTPYVSTLWRQVVIQRNGVEIANVNPRPVTLGLRYNKPDKYGKTAIDLAPLIVGQRWMGGDSKFYRAKATLYRSLNLPKENQLVFRGAWQVSPDALPPVQQFQIGGEYTVRGYTEGLITADRGQFYSLEHLWPVPFIGKINPALQGRIKGVTFIDFGQSWLDKSNPRYVSGVSSRRDHTTLLATGIGLRARISQYAQGFVDVAWGVFKRNDIELLSQPTLRIHFGLRTDLFPQAFKTRPAQPDLSKLSGSQ